jgi:hypothetical protein
MRSSTVSGTSVRNCGVSVRRTSATGANAETISDTGDTTDLSPCSSRQVVRIDKESLPTGIAMPKAGQSCMPTACTAAYSAASSPGSPQAAIQLADSRISLKRAMSAASTLVMASATAMRAEQAASSKAKGVRSPMA